MRRLISLAVLGCLAWATPGLAQEKFVLELELVSPDFPNLGTENKITGKAGEMFEFDGVLHLTSSGLTGEEGPQGWSLGVRNDKVDILGTTWAGTKTDDKSNGGLWEGGFRVFTVIDPANAKNMGKMGMTAAVVLSLTEGTSLPPNTKQPIGKNRYKATVPTAETKGFIRFEDGLVGKGQPVPNNITYKGSTVIPVKSEVVLTLAPEGPVGEDCTNGKDDDGDSKVDCADPDCAANAACKEDCDDKVDNDLDTKTDCADTDCAADPACKVVAEDCDDKVDNDGDSKVDCADTDCSADPACKVVAKEDCDDKVDNDGDSKVDCADTDCSADPACKVVGDTGFDLILDAPGSKREGNLNVIEIENKVGNTIIVTASIAPTKDPEPVGAQGWSISVTNEPQLTITKDATFPTIDGTDAGKLFSGGFKKTEVVDPAKNGGKEGFVSAVVLSLTEAINLDPSKAQTIARSQYTLEAGLTSKDFPIDIMFMDGLRGVGQPVPNVITVAGDTKTANRIINLQIREGEVTPGNKRFRRGDANDDGKVNIADPIWIINELVRQGPPTECKSAADANDDGRVDLSDSMYLITWRFQGGPSPPPPFPNCGDDPTQDTLPCVPGSAASCSAP